MEHQGLRAAVLIGAAWAATGCKTAERPDDEILGAAARAVSQTCVTVQRGNGGTVADTQVAGGDAARLAKNYGGSWTSNSGVIGGGDRQALFRFDLGGVPTGSGIISAVVTLDESNNAAATVRVHRVTAPWLENTVTWTSLAGAFSAAVEASFSNGGATYSGPVSFDITALAQAWVNDPTQNDGVLLEQDPAGGTRYWTSEDSTAGERPRMQVCYAAPTCSDGIQDQGERGVDCGGPCPNDCPHPPATEAVNGGDRSKSPHFTAVYTFGQPTQNQDKTTSPSYRVQGGLIGANGSLP